MKRTLIRGLLVVGLWPGIVLCEEETKKEKTASADPTAPSPKIDETLVKIRRVEELDKMIKDIARLADEMERLKQANAKDVASLGKSLDSVKQANTALSEKLDLQSTELNKQLKARAADFDKRLGDLNTHLEKQQQLLDDLQKTLVNQAAQQNKIVEALATRFDDLETRLTNIPPVSLQGFITGEDQPGAAILDLGGSQRVVREGDTVNLQPQDKNSVVRTIHVKRIADGSVLLEIGPWNQTLLVQ